jgi:hypothetical protein
MESTPQDTVKPRVPVRMVDEPLVTPRNEERSLQELQLSKETDNNSDLGDIPNEGILPDTTRDIKISEIAIESDPPLNYLSPDPIKNIVTPPSEARVTRIPSWKRKLTASTSERERTATSYGLRHKPAKKSL